MLLPERVVLRYTSIELHLERLLARLSAIVNAFDQPTKVTLLVPANSIERTPNYRVIMAMWTYRKCFPLLIVGLLCGELAVNAQSNYSLVGSARATPSTDYYFATQDLPGKAQTGAVWCRKLLNLAESFDLEFTVNFGANSNGADGIALVMQTQGTKALGDAGGGIGFRGLRPSFGIEFDTHFNGDMADPDFDHMTLFRDGITNHRLNSSFAAPVPILLSSKNGKDDKNHFVRLAWNAGTRQVQVYVDCVQRISQSVDLIRDIFGGTQQVYWGITASTGTAGNAHTLYLPEQMTKRKSIQVCPKDTVTLVAGIAVDNNYDWKPAIGLSNSKIRTPKLTAAQSQLYTVSYVNYCSELKTDSVFVNAKMPELNLGGNRLVCENEVVELSPVLIPADAIISYRWSTGDTSRTIKPTTSGLYTLRIMADNCSTTDSATVTFSPVPKLLLTQPTYDCPLDSFIVLDPRPVGSKLQFYWTPAGTNQPTLAANQPGTYTVKVESEAGCSAEQTFTILDNCQPATMVFLPTTFTPNGDGVNELFEWKSNTEIEARMSVYNRWGDILFSSINSRTFWDGTWKGQLCPSSVYSWQLHYRPRQGRANQWFVRQGQVILLR